mgnify:CR=1 FL=1
MNTKIVFWLLFCVSSALSGCAFPTSSSISLRHPETTHVVDCFWDPTVGGPAKAGWFGNVDSETIKCVIEYQEKGYKLVREKTIKGEN